MEQTKMNKQQARSKEGLEIFLNVLKAESPKLQSQLNKQQERLNRLKALSSKLEAYCDTRDKKRYDIRGNINKVTMELYSCQTEDINTIWNLCDKLRELIYNENKQCRKLYKNECKYYDCGYEIEKYENIIKDLHNKIRNNAKMIRVIPTFIYKQ